MKRFVFIVDGYYPKYSAVGVCVNNIIEELSSTNCEIIVITKKDSSHDENISYHKHYIRRYDTNDNRIRNLINQRLELSNGFHKKVLKIAKMAVRSYGYMAALLKKENIKNQEVKAIYNELEKINNPIDVIIPACLPFEGIVASIKFKKDLSSDVKVIPLLFDKFSANSTLHRTELNKNRKFNKHILLEREMFDKCDNLIFVESWLNHLKEYFEEYENKFVKIEHPLVKRVTSNKTVSYKCDKVNVVYTGALYKKNRSPLSALKLFAKLIENNNKIVVHFYITGDCEALVNDYCKIYPDNIINHGSVPTDVAKAAIINADILLSLGNMDITQLPSKIFEYISTGNTVIHFYSKENDPVINILNCYNNSYCIPNDDDNLDLKVAAILATINNLDDKTDFNIIQDIYNNATPKFVVGKIMELL